MILQAHLKAAAPRLPQALQIWGTLTGSDGSTVTVAGLARLARIGDGVDIARDGAPTVGAEVIAVEGDLVRAMLMSPGEGLASGARVTLNTQPGPRPDHTWLGRVLDAYGRDDQGLTPSADRTEERALWGQPPRGDGRRGLGGRLATGQAAMDTLLPICRGQRIGIFAGSGVGKSTLLTGLAEGLAADVVVIGLIGERGREVGEFARRLDENGALARSVVIAATSDQTALMKRRAGLLTLTVAEHFRDQGLHVLCLLDSVTRYAEAHREIALAAGEPPALRAFPPSTPGMIAALCERAGPGPDDGQSGDITAVFTVLVAGSDTEEPVSDMLRGTLDGHVILDRAIAERGRYPAIDIRRSVSRSAPMAWTKEEAALAAEARRIISAYEEAAPMIQAGLYTPGADQALDRAIRLYPKIEGFIATATAGTSPEESFALLAQALEEDPEQTGA